MSKIQTVHLFNCDKTYDLNAVEAWLEKERSKQGFSVRQHYFSLPKMFEISDETIPGLTMDLAVFVVHAHESRLSINEENAGIGYAMIYRALLQKTGGNVIIIIGGDDNYKNEDEESKEFISRWAKRKVSSQFNDEYMDGRKAFILSWNKEHRDIHEEALCHFLDPSKRGAKFEYKPKRKVSPLPGTKKTETSQQSKRDSFSEEGRSVHEVTSHAESAKHSSATMTARPNPLQEAEQDHSSGRATSDILSSDRSQLSSSGSVAVQDFRASSLEKNFSGLRETQGKSLTGGISPGKKIDLAILGCHISEESINILEEVFHEVGSSSHIKSPVLKNCSPVEAKVYLEENVARFCVLLADAEAVYDAYKDIPNLWREYQDLFEVAADRVAEKVIVLICKPCSLQCTEDEIFVNQIKSTSGATGKILVNFVEYDPKKSKPQRIRDIKENITDLIHFLKSQLYSNDSITSCDLQHNSNVTGRAVHIPLKGCKPAHWPQHTTEQGLYHQDAYQSQQSTPMQPHGSQRAHQDISLNKNEVVVLKTRLLKGDISLNPTYLEFRYPGWEIPGYLAHSVKKKYGSCSERILCVISNEKGELRYLVDKPPQKKGS